MGGSGGSSTRSAGRTGTRPARSADPLAEAKARLSFLGDVSESMKEAIAEEYAAFPQGVRDLLDRNGVELAVVGKLIDRFPELAGERPMGWAAGKTWEDADGVHHGGGGRSVALVAETARVGGVYLHSGRTRAVFAHEVGHAIDQALGNASSTARFQLAYSRDVARIFASDRARVGYFLQAGAAGRQEAFAEAFAVGHARRRGRKFGLNPSFAGLFAETIRVVGEMTR